MKGRTGENLLLLLESRLDNVVFRMGIAPSRQAARQLVTHRHITVDGEICNIPSALVRPGTLVAVRERSKNLEVIQENISRTISKYPWIEWDAVSVSGKFLSYPDRTEIPEPINEQLIVELYSK
jgi:small subunit ribosomal protein S4